MRTSRDAHGATKGHCVRTKGLADSISAFRIQYHEIEYSITHA